MSQPFYITTPIYYINREPHIGNAYTTIAADVINRFHRLAGRPTYFLTGTDEHGTKAAEAAAEAGLSEQEYCDRVAALFKEVWKELTIENDDFIRTTSKRHETAVLKFLDAMRGAKTEDGQDVIYSGYYEGLYCVGCEKFITEKELVDGLCPYHNRPPEKVKEKNYFFRLSSFLPEIKRRIEAEELVILPDERRREVLGLIKQDLPDFSISRERVKWGIPLSFDKTQVAYVWVDALSNYISAIGYADNAETFGKWWKEAEVVHLLAKDILKFHCIYWPAMLLGAGVPLPHILYVHGFFTVDGRKMSKSLGNQIDPNEMVAEFGPDGTRYLLLTQFPFGIDGDIQASRFIKQYNSDLANDLGNLVSRVVKMIGVHFDGKLPRPEKGVDGLDELMEQAEKLPGTAYGHITHFRLDSAIAEAVNLVRATNKFFNDRQPWILAKEGKRQELGGILYACCEVIRIISIILFPVLPNKMREVRRVLGLDDSTLDLDHARTFFDLKPGAAIELGDAIFPRLKPSKPDQSDGTADATGADDGLLDISEFARAKLCVAQVLEGERIEGADKLLKLQVDLGTEKRQIVAGIAEHYSPEEIAGKSIIVVTNLKPAVIRGHKSNGMLLAASKGKKLSLVTPDGELPPGSKVS